MKMMIISMLVIGATSLARVATPALGNGKNHDMRNYSPEDAGNPDLYFIVHGSGEFTTFTKDNAEYIAGVFTRNAKALYSACPSMDGEEVPCIVTFEHKGGDVTKILSSRKPAFVGMDIKQAGSLKMQVLGRDNHVIPADGCNSPEDVHSGHSFGCVTGSDTIYINKVNTATWVVEVVSNDHTYYVDVNYVIVNCHGSGETLTKYIADHLPPEEGSPAPNGTECR